MIREIKIAVLVIFCCTLPGCQPKSDNNSIDNIKINDLAPVYRDGSPVNNVLKAISLDFHIIDVPAENFHKLDEIRRSLNIKPIKFNNYLAFSANSFSAYYGRNQKRRTVYDILEIAGAQHVINQGIILVDKQSNDIPIQQLGQMQAVYYRNLNGEKESARIGPGNIVLHIAVKKAETFDNAAEVTIFPLFTRISGSSLSRYALMDKAQDFPFYAAAMQLNMIPGDFIFLAPEQYTDDQTSLSGLFFGNPMGSIFDDPDEQKLPTRRETQDRTKLKPSIKVYIITCVGLNF